jgi:plasmid stabilization system protein ParE
MFRLLVDGPATQDWVEAVEWYTNQEIDLGRRFNLAMRELLREIARDPARFPTIRKKTQRARLLGWPYSIYFVTNHGTRSVKVTAVWHGSRNPKFLDKRVA